jgi:hypothetical protein
MQLDVACASPCNSQPADLDRISRDFFYTAASSSSCCRPRQCSQEQRNRAAHPRWIRQKNATFISFEEQLILGAFVAFPRRRGLWKSQQKCQSSQGSAAAGATFAELTVGFGTPTHGFWRASRMMAAGYSRENLAVADM